MPPFRSLIFTTEFLDTLTSLSPSDQRRVLRSLALLDVDERHPSLCVHQLQGPLAGQWAASASRGLRVNFRRLEGGGKLLLVCSHHYGDHYGD